MVRMLVASGVLPSRDTSTSMYVGFKLATSPFQAEGSDQTELHPDKH